MKTEEISAMFERHNLVRGYVYPYKGHRSEYWFDHSPTNIANFIMQHREAREIILTDTMDNLILNTIGEFIDRCKDEEVLPKILEHLIPMQMGDAEPQEISVATDAEVEAYFNMCDGIKMDFGV